jgi:hypothetical protein
MRPAVFITFSLTTIFTLALSAPAQSTTHATYEVYALSYGVYPGYPTSPFVAGADKTRKTDAQMMMIWLIKGPGGRNIQ